MSRQARPRSFEPEVFGKYFLVDRIATGGMAEIFKSKTFSHGGFEHLVVIKRILPHISDNVDFIDMFIDEAKVSAALQHANVVRIYDFGRIDENFFIAMECVDGKDVRNLLRKLARQRTYLPPRFIAFIAHEACKGLFYAHTKTDLRGRPYGIVHRDVSPSNILVSYEADVKIVDFGIAKARSNAYQTRDGMLKGKFEYMSPEQADGQTIDHRSDLFSLGICMYEMMTNRRLFKTDNELATIKKVQSCDFQPPRAFNPDLPFELEAICLKALSRDPDDRYESAQQMGEALRSFLFPATSEALRLEMRAFMHEVFGGEILEERQRLEAGTEVAIQLRDNLAVDGFFDGDTRPSMTPLPTVVPHEPPAPRGRAGSWFAGFGVLLLGLAAVGMVGVGAYITVYRPDVVDSMLAYDLFGAPSVPTGLDLEIKPVEARILIDGEDHGVAQQLELELAPGIHRVRLEADGFLPLEESVEVESGRVTKMTWAMKQDVAPAPRPRRRTKPRDVPDPEPAEPEEEPEAEEGEAGELMPTLGEQRAADPDRPVVYFSSKPLGAQVTVDGRNIGTTPMSWLRAQAGGIYAVEMSLEGHRVGSGTLSELRGGENNFSLTLEPVPAQMEILLVNAGWAEVYVDGRKLSKTAPLRAMDVAPGTHEIRVVNEQLGLDETQEHEFVAGKTTSIRIK